MSSLSDEVVTIVSDVFDVKGVSPDRNFDDLEATSVLFLRLMLAIQGRFDIELDVVDMYSVDYVADLIQLVEERVPQRGAPTA